MSSDNPPKPVIDWAAIRHNAFTENPGSDWIALDANLMPIGRASDLGAVMKGCPGAHAYVQKPVLVPYQAPSPVLAAVLQAHEEAKQTIAGGFGLAPLGPPMTGEPVPVPDDTSDTATTLAAVETAIDAPVLDPDGNEPNNETAPASTEPAEPAAPISGAAAFDHDGDGKVGGSRSRNRNRSRKAAKGE